MRRQDLQKLAHAKIEDARLSLEHGRFGNSYYFAGYAVELGLKACIAPQISAETIPDRRFLSSVFDRGLKRLVTVAESRRNSTGDDGTTFLDTYWGIVV